MNGVATTTIAVQKTLQPQHFRSRRYASPVAGSTSSPIGHRQNKRATQKLLCEFSSFQLYPTFPATIFHSRLPCHLFSPALTNTIHSAPHRMCISNLFSPRSDMLRCPYRVLYPLLSIPLFALVPTTFQSSHLALFEVTTPSQNLYLYLSPRNLPCLQSSSVFAQRIIQS